MVRAWAISVKNGKHPIRMLPVNNIFLSVRYVGIIQIRLSVEGHTFLSACHTSSRLFDFHNATV